MHLDAPLMCGIAEACAFVLKLRTIANWEFGYEQIGNFGKRSLCMDWMRERNSTHTSTGLNLEADLMDLRINGNGNESTVTLQTLCSSSNVKWLSVFL